MHPDQNPEKPPADPSSPLPSAAPGPDHTDHTDPVEDEYNHDPDYDYHYHDPGHWEAPHEPEPMEQEGIVDIKVFLTNVERFRWFVIKSLAALVIGMVVCLVAGNRVIELLEWPLRTVKERVGRDRAMVVLKLAGDRISRQQLPVEEFQALFPGMERSAELRLSPIPHSEGQILGFKPMPLSRALAEKALVDLHVYDPMGAFWVAFQVAFYGGLVVAAPFIFYFLGQFLLPFLGGEFTDMRKALGRWVTIAAALFFTGMAFCYLLLLRVSLYGSVGFANWMTFAADEWSATDYISFVCKFTVAMGFGFQLPVVILLLVRIGILNYQKLAKFRPYWVVMNLVASAFITPDGSPVTMILMAAPLWGLYEISVLIAWKWARDAAAAEAAASGG